jgi:hypothetical protein
MGDAAAALRSALGPDRCGRCDDAVLDYVASVLEDEAFDDVDAALEAVGPLLVRFCGRYTRLAASFCALRPNKSSLVSTDRRRSCG